MLSVNFDDRKLRAGMNKVDGIIIKASKKSLEEMADTLLLLSRYEVPHDEGTLQASGHVGHDGGDVYVAYNTEYAAYQHEGVRSDGSRIVKHYQKGRKKKYLEDPLKHNISKWQEIAKKELQNKLKNL